MQPIAFTFPAAVTTAIAAAQTVAANVGMIINGTLLDLPSTMSGTRRAKLGAGINRTVSLTSTGNISGVNFVIVGLNSDGAAVTETRAGPNNNTVETTALFNTVTSITPNGTVGTATSAGSGTTGATGWVVHDSYQAPFNVSVVVDATATVSYTVQYTNDDVFTVASPFALPWSVALTGASTDLGGSITAPAMASRILLVSSSGSGALTGTFIQSGH